MAKLGKTPKSKSAKRKLAKASAQSDLQLVFAQIKDILTPYEKHLSVAPRSANDYWLETRSPTYLDGKPFFFSGVSMRKGYVSFYSMPVYMCPELTAAMSHELQAHRHGKSCFNFKTSDPRLWRELAGITRKGFSFYRKRNLL